ncbi:glucosidase : Uncharacterized protein OS=Solibacter usitatus (strain Ellin6076) GN=Acid_4508 PE=4 SV=1 [Gemmata massiliana]|uniref:Glucosidase: Uncharacterized protein n=1 Tax=Gemmata massiliana TaxID=1210884 RepID=A0A6P2D0N6_9BACT|nr:glucosidase [Gemmata massiliana]VTR92982.1 glucosidase : Uncharacterized protein OS=Solibacter usitatus (strain Ellin6076) GN=Acid_4508 PE=4 SV=1 [Gemmata massiliana]
MNAEAARLEEARAGAPWRKWGPYLSERQWGTVREDYSESGNAWDYFSHDQARSRAYRRGEDGLAGLSDDKQLLCFALALWNGADPIIKERLFGLTNSEGNHGEDVKEYYYYLDSTPTHSYMRYLYKYPQGAYPYSDIVDTNRGRGRTEPEYELVDTGAFANDRYFDVFVEYAKAAPEDVLVRVTIANRGAEPATLHVLPTLWFRNTWSWGAAPAYKPALHEIDGPRGLRTVVAAHEELGPRWFYCDGEPELLFTENETNNERVFSAPSASPFVKDAIDRYLVHGERAAVNPAHTGTKVAAHYTVTVPPGGQTVIRLRLSDTPPGSAQTPFGAAADTAFSARTREADEFYASVLPRTTTADEASVARQALAGMLWSKQFYSFNVHDWLVERGVDPMRQRPITQRNRDWFHMANAHVISMPDKWEYPWYAAWDLAFHCVPLAMVDSDFAKQQLDLMLSAAYLHPNGQLPAYEWNFSDVNPPVHAWAALYVYRIEQARRGEGDRAFLARMFSKLMLNFTWWVNRKDRFGHNVFEGGFLGLDNIGVFDRSAPLPGGGYLEQADGTAWMAMFCQNMFEIGVELAAHDPGYDELTTKFVEHFLWIANALNRVGDDGMWDEEDGFYYDVLRFPDGRSERLKVRSLVGLLPLAATCVIEPGQRERVPHMMAHMAERVRAMPHLLRGAHPLGEANRGCADRGLAALVGPERLRRILSRVLDENEFLGPYGLRSISRYHLDHPYSVTVEGQEYRVAYLPAESDSGMFGGNSNWRGPVWFPINILIVRSLLHFYLYYGDTFRVECPTGSGVQMNLFEVAREISTRLNAIFLKDASGRRPVFGAAEKFQTDPHFRDHVLFYEYFHGDNGAGIGASHQTGWTGLVAKTIELFRTLDAEKLLETGRSGAYAPAGCNGVPAQKE